MAKTIFLLLYFTAWSVLAQDTNKVNNYFLSLDSASIKYLNRENKNSFSIKKPKFGMEIGTGLSHFSGGGSMVNTYVAPHLSFDVNAKLKINIGGIFVQGNTPGMSSFYDNSQNFTLNRAGAYTLYAQGMYQLNKRVVVTGSAMKEKYAIPRPKIIPGVMDLNYKSFSMGINYKITDYLKFAAEFRFSEGINPYYTPYSRRIAPYYSSFYHPSFTIW